jgi:hypothetical protein
MSRWKSSSGYELCPEGIYPATCVEVLDIGTQETNYGDKHQTVLGFELVEEDNAGNRYFRRRTLTRTLHPKSTTRDFIESMLGRKLTIDEASGDFEDRDLLGAKCAVEIRHDDRNGKIYDNVVNITGLMKGATCPEPKLAFMSSMSAERLNLLYTRSKAPATPSRISSM